MKRYERIGIDANRDKFWNSVDSTYSRLIRLLLIMVISSAVFHRFMD